MAVKLLHAGLARDRDRAARFAREAQVLAALNHPHIAAIYGLEEAGSAGEGDGPVQFLLDEPVWDPIRTDPRFPGLVRRMGNAP